MKVLKYSIVAAFLLGTAAGCSSTLTVGPRANTDGYLGANASTQGASVTLPLIKGEVKAAQSTKKKK
jgi:hypothetical protein